MSKTFDKVRHDLLLHKLQEAASGGNLLTKDGLVPTS